MNGVKHSIRCSLIFAAACSATGSGLVFAQAKNDIEKQREKPITTENPYLAEAWQQVDQQNYFDALSLIGVNQRRAARSNLEGADPQIDADRSDWLAALSAIGFGFPDRASDTLEELGDRTPTTKLRGAALLELAKLQYERGMLEAAEATLKTLDDRLPRYKKVNRIDLLSRAALAQGRFEDAADILNDIGQSQMDPYMRYNLAVSYIKTGQEKRGLKLMGRVGQLPIRDLQTHALRDRANLALGYSLLDQGNGGTARPVLERIRIDGPFSSQALLGVGWAQLAPDGKIIPEIADDLLDDEDPLNQLNAIGIMVRPRRSEDLFGRLGLRPLRAKESARIAGTRINKALIAWVELLERTPIDEAITESWLAVPFALQKLGAHEQALELYLTGIEKLDARRLELAKNKERIRSNRMLNTMAAKEPDSEAGWNWPINELPDAEETYLLSDLIATTPYQEGVKNYRDIRMLRRRLGRWRLAIESLLAQSTGRSNRGLNIEFLIGQTRMSYQRQYTDLDIDLSLDEKLSNRGSIVEDIIIERYPKRLKLSAVPQNFGGQTKDLRQMIPRIEQQYAKLGAAETDQAALLQVLAENEIDAQDEILKRYLIEARFAAARLFESGIERE